MWIDAAIAFFLILCIFRGEKHGFVHAFISTFGWILSLAGAVFFKPELLVFLDAHTDIRRDVTIKMTEYFKGMIEPSSPEPGKLLPQSVIDAINAASDKVVTAAAEKLAVPAADIIISVTAFFAIIFAIRIVMFIFERFIKSRSDKKGAVGNINGIAGMIFNLIKGCIVSYIAILFLMVIALTGNIESLQELLRHSLITGFLLKAELLPFSAGIFSGFSITDLLP